VKREDAPSVEGPDNDIEFRMITLLRQHGYSDIRHHVPLDAFPESTDTAEIVAFEDDLPVVLCCPVKSGVDDVSLREAARVKAIGVRPEHPARIVWISDGKRDYYYDVQENVAISYLPKGPEQDLSR